MPEILAVGLPDGWTPDIQAALDANARLCEAPFERALEALGSDSPAALIVDPQAIPGDVFVLVQAARNAFLPVFWIVGSPADGLDGLAIPTEWNIHVAPRSDGPAGLCRQIDLVLGMSDAGKRKASEPASRAEGSISGHDAAALIVSGNPAATAALEQEARARNLRTVAVNSLSDARASVERHLPDAIVLDILTPVRAGESESLHLGLRFFEDVSEGYPDVPIVVYTTSKGYSERATVVGRGARFLDASAPVDEVIDAVLWSLRPGERKPDRVMVVSHDRVVLDGLESVLARRGMVATTIGGSEYDIFRLWDAYVDFGPDVLVVDAELPGMSTESFCRVVRDDSSSQLLPMIFIGGRRDATAVRDLLAVGADDYVQKDDLYGMLVPKIEHWLRRVQWQRETAYVDPLTGLLNRRGARTALARSFDQVHRSHSVMSLVLLDLDNFKQINTRFGLSAGDEALRRLADRLRATFKRQIDVIARYGGEEFLLGLSSTEKTDAVQRLNELLTDLEARHLCDAIPEPVTFSAGVATYPFDATDLDGLREIASRRMGRAKELGKHRVESTT